MLAASWMVSALMKMYAGAADAMTGAAGISTETFRITFHICKLIIAYSQFLLNLPADIGIDLCCDKGYG